MFILLLFFVKSEKVRKLKSISFVFSPPMKQRIKHTQRTCTGKHAMLSRNMLNSYGLSFGRSNVSLHRFTATNCVHEAKKILFNGVYKQLGFIGLLLPKYSESE